MEREYEEYRLKSTTAANVTHNVMILQSQSANFQDFTPPVRLIRDRHYDSDSDEDGMDVDDGKPKRPEPVQAGRGKRKRTRILWLEDEDEIALREQESAPWLLEDFDGQHAFSGRLEGGQQGNYVFFVNQGNEFRVLPISRWYRFQPKLAFQPLSLEEAEAQMAKGVGGAAIAGPAIKKTGQEEGDEAPKRKLDRLLRPATQAKPAVGKSGSRDEGEDLDFEDIFDDDDEGVGEEDRPAESDGPRKKKVTSLHGRQVKKLIRNLDGGDNGEEDDEDEEDEVDPYADEDDLEEIADLIAKPANALQVSASQQTSPPSNSQKVPQPAPARPPVGSLSPTPSQQQTQQSQSSSQQSQKATSSSRTTSPALSATGTTQITEADIREILRGQPMTTKDLIVRLKPKLKADPTNKETLRELIKRMAMMKPSVSGDDEKLLELRPEFR